MIYEDDYEFEYSDDDMSVDLAFVERKKKKENEAKRNAEIARVEEIAKMKAEMNVDKYLNWTKSTANSLSTASHMEVLPSKGTGGQITKSLVDIFNEQSREDDWKTVDKGRKKAVANDTKKIIKK